MVHQNQPGWIDVGIVGLPVRAGCTTALSRPDRSADEPSDLRQTQRYGQQNLALHVGDTAASVNSNRRALMASLGATQMQWLNQVHGTQVVKAQRHSCASTPDADAVWTTEPGLALTVLTADCVPVLVWDSQGQVVGAAHAGWQGLRDGVLGSLLERLPVSAQQLHAWIGPCISQPHYEVGADVWEQFIDYVQTQGNAKLLAAHPQEAEKRLLDLAGIAATQLAQLGVSDVRRSGLCTFADQRFYSHRRSNGATGRMASVIMLLPEEDPKEDPA